MTELEILYGQKKKAMFLLKEEKINPKQFELFYNINKRINFLENLKFIIESAP